MDDVGRPGRHRRPLSLQLPMTLLSILVPFLPSPSLLVHFALSLLPGGAFCGSRWSNLLFSRVFPLCREIKLQAEIWAKLNRPISWPELGEKAFALVVSFGRCRFRLCLDTVALILQATIGGTAAHFKVSCLHDRTFKFFVASKEVGFFIRKLRSFSCVDYSLFFHFWGNGGPDWKFEFQNFLDEERGLPGRRSLALRGLNPLRIRSNPCLCPVLIVPQLGGDLFKSTTLDRPSSSRPPRFNSFSDFLRSLPSGLALDPLSIPKPIIIPWPKTLAGSALKDSGALFLASDPARWSLHLLSVLCRVRLLLHLGTLFCKCTPFLPIHRPSKLVPWPSSERTRRPSSRRAWCMMTSRIGCSWYKGSGSVSSSST